MAFIKVKPKQGYIVRHPETLRILNANGEEVTHSSYWERRIKDGDVSVIPEPEKEHAELDRVLTENRSSSRRLKEDN